MFSATGKDIPKKKKEEAFGELQEVYSILGKYGVVGEYTPRHAQILYDSAKVAAPQSLREWNAAFAAHWQAEEARLRNVAIARFNSDHSGEYRQHMQKNPPNVISRDYYGESLRVAEDIDPLVLWLRITDKYDTELHDFRDDSGAREVQKARGQGKKKLPGVMADWRKAVGLSQLGVLG